MFPPLPPVNVTLGPVTVRSVLQPNDFTLIGTYDIQTNGSDSSYGYCLTHRYINGDLRFLTYEFAGAGTLRLVEFSLAGKLFGNLITQKTNSWLFPNMYSHHGIWWDEAHQRLINTMSEDYVTTYRQAQIYTRTLNPNGTTSNIRGPVGLLNIGQKRTFGGMQPIPQWFQTKYNVGPYAVGFGGYTSLMAQGGMASLGSTCYAMPDPDSIPVNTETSNFKVLLDHSSGSRSSDWYSQGHPTVFDRGARVNNPINYFDGGDPRPNPSTPPSVPPVSTAGWLSPSPDTKGRNVWGDSFRNNTNWIDGSNKHGFVQVGSFGGGKCYYMSSSLYCDHRVHELHIYDPDDLAPSLKPWLIQPKYSAQLSLPGLGMRTPAGLEPTYGISGATFDSVGKKLYMLGYGLDNNIFIGRLYVYQVND